MKLFLAFFENGDQKYIEEQDMTEAKRRIVRGIKSGKTGKLRVMYQLGDHVPFFGADNNL